MARAGVVNKAMHLIFGLFVTFSVFSPVRAGVVLREDEITLPPLLEAVSTSSSVSESRLNVSSASGSKRQALAGEWLDFGDQIKLPPRIAAEVVQKENFLWVGGGVLDLQIGPSPVVKDDLTYDLHLTHGWMKIWIRAEKDFRTTVRLQTPHGFFTAEDAQFWINTRPEKTELYVVQGEVKRESSKEAVKGGAFASFGRTAGKASLETQAWNANALEVKISSPYLALAHLASSAQKDWDSGKSSEIYAGYRKKGWRKAARLDPIAK